MTREELAAAAALAAQFYADGHAAALTPEAGHALGFDAGYSANTADRAFVHAVIAGFEAGCAARHELAAALLDRDRERVLFARRESGRDAASR